MLDTGQLVNAFGHNKEKVTEKINKKSDDLWVIIDQNNTKPLGVFANEKRLPAPAFSRSEKRSD